MARSETIRELLRDAHRGGPAAAEQRRMTAAARQQRIAAAAAKVNFYIFDPLLIY